MRNTTLPLLLLLCAAFLGSSQAQEEKKLTPKQAKALFDKADKALNEAWAAAKSALSEDEFNKLKEDQRLMAAGDVRAQRIYETIGCYLGHAIAHYSDFYDLQHVLILGRVTSGAGGEIILTKAGEVLRVEFPVLAEKIQLRTPDEKDKRHGQAVAAASLPATRKK